MLDSLTSWAGSEGGSSILGILGQERSNRQNYKIHAEKLAHSAWQNKAARRHDVRMLKRRQEFNSAEALKARKFERRMSNTKIQRRIRDLKKAGLNPILAGQYATSGNTGIGAASVSGGGSPGMTSPGSSPNMENVIGAGIQSASTLKQAEAALQTADSHARQVEANIKEIVAKIDKIDHENRLLAEQKEHVGELILHLQEERKRIMAETQGITYENASKKAVAEMAEKHPLLIQLKEMGVDGKTVAHVASSFGFGSLNSIILKLFNGKKNPIGFKW